MFISKLRSQLIYKAWFTQTYKKRIRFCIRPIFFGQCKEKNRTERKENSYLSVRFFFHSIGPPKIGWMEKNETDTKKRIRFLYVRVNEA
jgi:hypothetical protein